LIVKAAQIGAKRRFSRRPSPAEGDRSVIRRRALAQVLLGTVVVATSRFAIRYYDGHDFIYNVWTPIHGLLAGLNPYDPTNAAYFQHYPTLVVAGLYTPTALLLHAPLALLTPSRSADVMAILNVLLIWLGVVLLIPPRTARSCFAAGTAGALLVLSSPAAHTIELGQLSAWAFAGLALVAASLRAHPQATWLPSIGTTLVALKPQSGIPMLLALALLGSQKVLWRAAAILIVTSIPGMVLFVTAAGSLSAAIRTILDNLTVVSRLPPTDLAAAYNLRIDGLGIVSHLHGPALTGLVWPVVFLVFATISFALIRSISGRSTDAAADPCVMSFVALYIVVALYHLTYDQLLLDVGPLAALSVVAESARPSQSSRVLAFGGLALMAVELVLRPRFRNGFVDLGIPALLVHTVWVVTPTLIAGTLIIWITVLGYHEGKRLRADVGRRQLA
jgi:hypothetical protein